MGDFAHNNYLALPIIEPVAEQESSEDNVVSVLVSPLELKLA
jgi:hypothetical protein